MTSAWRLLGQTSLSHSQRWASESHELFLLQVDWMKTHQRLSTGNGRNRYGGLYRMAGYPEKRAEKDSGINFCLGAEPPLSGIERGRHTACREKNEPDLLNVLGQGLLSSPRNSKGRSLFCKSVRLRSGEGLRNRSSKTARSSSWRDVDSFPGSGG